MTHNWCHGPSCHEKVTLDRIRGSKGNKVLRTKKISINQYGYPQGVWSHFCSQGCWNDFMHKHWLSAIALEPRTKPLETPIKDPVKTTHNNGYYNYNNWDIQKKVVDNA